jgi:hypothetical protein
MDLNLQGQVNLNLLTNYLLKPSSSSNPGVFHPSWESLIYPSTTAKESSTALFTGAYLRTAWVKDGKIIGNWAHPTLNLS